MIEIILADLDAQADLFDLSGDLGTELLDVAAVDLAERFDNQRDADGGPWPALSHKYQEWKDNAYPGQPIGVRTGMLRAELIGERETTTDRATLAIGATEDAKAEYAWLSEGDALNNRPPRPSEGLSAEAVERVDAILDGHFERHV